MVLFGNIQMRLSSKTIIQEETVAGISTPSDFIVSEVNATVRDKGISCIYQRAIPCPCKDQISDSLNVCKNCGSTGWAFVNPTKTQMIISAISSNKKFEQFGIEDLGMVNITAFNDQKFGLMDMVIVQDATASHSQILYPSLKDDQSQFFCYTKYSIIKIESIFLFVDPSQKLKRLIEGTDYLFRDNVITLDVQYNNLINPSISIRYLHAPVYHILDIYRESFTSTQGSLNQGRPKLILPIHAIAKRAHLIKDVENFDGDRLLDNSWLPNSCEPVDSTAFHRQLKYATAQEIYDNLTSAQIIALDALMDQSV